MEAAQFVHVLKNVGALQKGCDSSNKVTDGLWLIYDPVMKHVNLVAMTGHILYWEKGFPVDDGTNLHAHLEDELTRPANTQCFPCRIPRNAVAELAREIKAGKYQGIWLDEFIYSGKEGVNLGFVARGLSANKEVVAYPAEDKLCQSMLERLYEDMVWHRGKRADAWRPMSGDHAANTGAEA